MINYSVCLQANPASESAPEKAYAKPQMSELMTFNKFVRHIANHNGVYSRGTVKGVISDMCECLVEMLLEGKKVQLGGRGNAGSLHRPEHQGGEHPFHAGSRL